MRVAGRLASELLDYLTPHVAPGVTTGAINDLAHDYMVNQQGTIPATLNYAPPGHTPYPASLCTSVNHVVCHGIPGDKKLKDGDIVNIDVTVIKDGYHGDTSRMFYRRQAVHPGEAPGRDHLRGDVARHPRRAPGRAPGRHRATIQKIRRRPRLLGRARILRPRHRHAVPRGPAGAALRPRRHRTQAAAGNDLHRRADDQRRQAGHPLPGRRLDDRHRRSFAVRAMGTHGPRHRCRRRRADDLGRRAPPPPAA